MASDIKGILSRYTIDNLDLLSTKGKGNLLVQDPKLQNGIIWADLLDVPWGGFEQFGDPRWATETNSGAKVVFECDEFIRNQVLQSTKILLYDFELDKMDTTKKIYQLKSTTRSFITTWYSGVTAAHWTLNLCCGGYGGWEYAFQIAHDHGWPYHFHIGLDHSLPAAAQHSVNHQTQFIPNVQLAPSFLADRHKSTTICASIEAQGWRQAVSMINPQIWTFSFPCQSWTGAAWSKGFLDDNGKVLLEGLGLARIMRPAIILLENVKNFSSHQQYSEFCQAVHWSGYRFLHQAIVDAQERTPCIRPRWLAILERIEESHQPFHWPKWEVKKHNLMTWGCHLKSTPEEMNEFRLPPEVVQKYMDISYLPLHAPYWAKNNVLNHRAVPLQNKMPVVMAAYGRQHELRDELLQNRGLFGHFTAEECKFRWWKPVELIMAHMQIVPMALLRPKENAWQTIGNCIVQHHALITVYAAFDHMFGPNKHTLEEILTEIESKRMTPGNVTVNSDEFAWYLGHQSGIESIQKYVKILSQELSWGTSKNVKWPDNCIFDFHLGCISMDYRQNMSEYQVISPTIPYSLQECPKLDEYSREENSPLESPADHIPDTLDVRIQQHFQAIENDEKKYHSDPDDPPSPVISPLKQDDYQIETDESMNPESENECTDEFLQKGLQQLFEPVIVEVPEVSHMVTLLLEPGNYAALCILNDLTAKDLTQLWDHRVALINAERYCQTAPRTDPYFSPDETIKTGCLMSVVLESQYQHQAVAWQNNEKLLIFDIAGQTFAQTNNKQATPDLRRFPVHEQRNHWYDEIGETSQISLEVNMRVFPDIVENDKFHDIQMHIGHG